MILDLHNHSVKSDDARARVDNYCRWIRSRRLCLDGFVLTEHRQFDADSDYRRLEDEFGLCILKGAEVETDYGHVLLFGVNEDLVASFDFARVDLPIETVLGSSERCGAIAVPCHPGRARVGMSAHVEKRGSVDGVRIVEVENGGSRGDEDARAKAFAKTFGYAGIGGSDSHIVSHIGRCATRFPREIRDEEDLADALRGGHFEALRCT